ncbi:laccase-23-like [Formica exsecta]|uniref:laccase-23-like n=1 Tax=Formica exsecta TaxID=72781 RepID=UPI00114114B7|nr:laccase-23-like [Formica exsecta]
MLFRFGIFIGLGSVVATIIYFTPIPEQTFLSCDRPCHHLDWPMICRVKLTLEVFQSLSKSCGNCPLNQTACLDKHCVSADGQRRGILTANRQMPGPSIQVCENDILVVDVINRLPGKAVAVHWRGQTQMEMPYMDGVPLITQCPIPSYTTFQYKFRASSPGTHLWHVHQDIDEIGTNRLAVTTNPAKCGGQESLCVMDIQNMRKMPRSLAMPRMDVTMYLPINYKMQATELIGNSGTETRVLNVDNSTFTFPSSPLLTQGGDVSPDMICSNHDDDDDDADNARNENNDTVSRRRCRPIGDGASSGASNMCECVHVRRIPLGATVEIILLDQGGLDDLVYHLHGYSFYVVGAKHFGRSMSLQEVKKLDERKQLFVRNLDCAPTKDTIVVPKFGAVALRFKADNPGYWMLRDEHAADWTRGLDVVLQIGESNDMMPAPQDFPKCGSFVGPDYFLI